MKIDKRFNGISVTDKNGEIRIVEGKKEKFEIASSHRIGVTKDLKRKLRFYVKGNRFVSR